ncbi:MAG: hypothetical protein RL226_1298 [Bacteroidota bacterium]|jgi:hypothetical protein
MKNVNLKNELSILRKNKTELEQQAILEEVFHLLHDEYCSEKRIALNLASKGETGDFDVSRLRPEMVYHVDEIKQLCIQYRLRFLQSTYFKGKFPASAIAEIKGLEKKIGTEIKEFFVVAPSDMFALEDCDQDPLLFMPISQNYYYLIATWGADLAWYRKALVFPFRNFTTLGLSVASISVILAFLLPADWLMRNVNQGEFFARLAFFGWSFICISAILTYVGFAFFKNVSAHQWNSHLFKQEF